MAINIVTLTAGAIYIQTGIGAPTHVAPKGSQFTDTASAKLYRNLDGQTNWQEDISSTGVTQSISAFTTFNSTTSGQSSVIADSFNDTITFSGVNMSILTNDITKTMTFSGSSDGSHLSNIPISGVDNLQSELDALSGETISAFTFNQVASEIKITTNNGTMFPIDVTSLAQGIFIVSGEYDPINGTIEFTNSTGGTFIVTGFTTGITDTFIDGGTFNDSTYNIAFSKNIGLGFNVDLSDIRTDITTTATTLISQINTKADEVDFNTHTGDTSIHYTKSSILLNELGDSGHTHPIAEVNGLQGELDSKTDNTDFNTHTADTSIHYTKSSILLSELGDTAHTHTIAEVNNLQTELDSKTDDTDFNAHVADFDTHTGDTSIHYTKSSILLSELGDTAHTHTIAEINNLQTELDSKTDDTDFITHTADTSIHYTKSSILLSELGNTAHTHTISEVNGLQTELDDINSDISDNFDNIISGVTFNNITNLLNLNKNNDTSFVADLSSLAKDGIVVSGEYDPSTSELTFTNNTGGTFTVTGVTSGMTDTFVNSGTFNGGTYDIDFTKNIGPGFSIDLSDINDDITATTLNLQTQINLKANESSFNSHTADTSIHYTKSSILLSELGDTAHTHTISEVNNLQSELDSKTDDIDFNAHVADFGTHTGDTSIHYTKSSILLSELGDTAHTHTIAEVNGLQAELDSKTDDTNFDTHTADTSIHYTKSSILLSELGDTAHTHTIAEVNGLQNQLNIINSGITDNFDNIISGVTFNNNILSIDKNDDTSFVADLSSLAKDALVVSGEYNPITSELTFTNNTGGTFTVTGVTSGSTDTFVDSAVINPTTYEVDFTKNIGLGFDLDLSSIQNDIVTGDTALQNQITSHVSDGNNPHNTTFSNLLSTAHTHTISDVSNLGNILDNKLDLSGGTLTGTLTGTEFFGSGIGLTDIPFSGTNVGGGAVLMDISDVTEPKFKSLTSNDNSILFNESATEINITANVAPPSGTSAEFVTFIGRNSTPITGITASAVQLPFDTTDSNKPEVFTYNADTLTINKAGTYQFDYSVTLIGDVNNNRSSYEIYYTINDVEPAGARSTIYGRQNNFGGEATVVSLLTNVMSGDTIKVYTQRVVGGGNGEIRVAGIRVRLMKFDNLVVDSVDWDNITNRPDLSVAVGDLLGEWDASTNTPTITSGSHTGNTGDFYIVSTSGTTNIDGNDMWAVNDWIVWSASQFQWLKIDNQSGVVSVNGFQGIVNLDTDDIPEGSNNLYMTTAEKSKLSGIETGAQVNVQSDLAQTNSGATDFVLNKLAEHIEFDNSSVDLSSTDVQEAIEELSNEKLDITGGTVTGDLNVTGSVSATTYFGDGSNLTGVSNLYVTGMTYDNSNNLTITRNDDTSFTTNITEFTGLTVNGVISGSSISINGGEIMTRIADSDDFRLLHNGASTGVIEYNGLSSNIFDDSNFDLSAVKGWIVDNITDPQNPVSTYVDFPGSSISNPSGVTLDFLATHPVTYIGLTGSTTSDIVQSNMPFTETESRNILNLGVVVHSNNTNINAINNKPKLLIDDTQQTYDLFSALGDFNLGNSDGGNVFTANGANLSINKSEGRVFSFGSNYITDPRNPHIINLTSLVAPSFRYRLQDSTEFGDTTFIDPNNYDVSSVLTSVPTNKFTVQRITIFVSNLARIQYGQEYYDNLDDAEASINTQDFVTEQNIAENGLLRAFLIVKEGTTDLSDPTKARFINASQFGHATETATGNVHRTQILNSASTGLRTGGIISISGPTTIDISAGSGQVIDNFTDPMNPEFTDVVWDDITGTTVTALTASVFTFIAIDKNQNVVTYPSNVPPTAEDRRDNILLGAVSHQFGSSLETAINAPIPISSPINQIEDLASAIGPFSIRGNTISGVGGTLELNKTNGSSFFYGRNFQTNKKSPSTIQTPALFSPSMFFAKGDSFIFNTGNTIDVDNYDPNGAGVITAVPNNDFVAHRIWHLPGNNSLIFQYGQFSYSTFNIALERFSSEPLIIPDGLEEGGYLSAIIIAQEGETDLTAADVRIIPQGKFAGGGGGTGGGGADTLQSAYNNGTNPEIITDGTRTAVDFRTGSGLDSTNVVTFQQNNGTINGSITGLGTATFNNILGTTISGTSFSGDGSGLTNLFIPPLQQTIKVAKSGATYSTIQSAIDDITDASLTKQYYIEVCPGIYTEDVIMKPYITLVGAGLTTIVKPTAPSNTIFECSGAFHSAITNLSVSGATASGGTAFNIDTLMPGDGIVLENISFYSNDKFVNVKSPTGTTATVSVRNSIIPPSSVFTTGFDVGGEGVNNVDISGLRGSINPFNSGLLVKGSGENNLLSLSSIGLVSIGTPDAIEVSDGIKLVTQSIALDGFNNGLMVTDSGSGPELNVNDLVLSDINNTAVSIQNIGATGSVGGSWSFNQIDIINGSDISMVFSDPTDDGVAVSVLGDVFQADNTETILNLSKLVRQSTTLGLVSGGTLTSTGGLSLDVSGGNGFLYNTTINEVLEANWTGETLSLTDNAKNFIFINENLNVTMALSRPAFGTVVFLGIANTLNGEIEFIERNELKSLIHGNKVEEYLRHVLGIRYTSGSLFSEGTTDRTLDIGSGVYNFGTTIVNPTGGTEVEFTQYYRDGSSSWVTTATTLVNNTHYDDGSGTLQPLTSGYYAKHALYTTGEGNEENYMLVLGQQEFSAATTAFGAELGPLPLKPNIFDGTNIALLGSIIVREGESNIFKIEDLRPISVSGPQGTTGGSSGGGGVTFHGDLTGLLNDDHTQYLLTSGTRAMTGDLNMGGNIITNVSTVDGVDVNSHASRHLPNGLDPLTTGVPSTIGGSNSEGVANAFARQDHIHDHGNQPGGTLHNEATVSTAGFMSAADKTQIGILYTGGTIGGDLTTDNLNTGDVNATNLITTDLTVNGDVTGDLTINGDVYSDIFSGNTTDAIYYGDGSNLTGVGEVNDAINVGSGNGLFTGKTGTDLQFKSIIAGDNITITPSSTAITIESTGGGSSRIESNITTTNAITTELEKIDTLTDNATNIIEVYVKAYQTATGAQWGVWKRTLTVTKTSGTVTIREINADVDKTSSGLSATSIAFNVNGGDIDLDVTGITSTNIRWDSAYEIIL